MDTETDSSTMKPVVKRPVFLEPLLPPPTKPAERLLTLGVQSPKIEEKKENK